VLIFLSQQPYEHSPAANRDVYAPQAPGQTLANRSIKPRHKQKVPWRYAPNLSQNLPIQNPSLKIRGRESILKTNLNHKTNKLIVEQNDAISLITQKYAKPKKRAIDGNLKGMTFWLKQEFTYFGRDLRKRGDLGFDFYFAFLLKVVRISVEL